MWPDNAKYEGEFKNNKFDGKGKIIHAHGDIYQGECKDGKANGFGILIQANGIHYEGMWLNDL